LHLLVSCHAPQPATRIKCRIFQLPNRPKPPQTAPNRPKPPTPQKTLYKDFVFIPGYTPDYTPDTMFKGDRVAVPVVYYDGTDTCLPAANGIVCSNDMCVAGGLRGRHLATPLRGGASEIRPASVLCVGC
jgi:hypothetical protein